MSTSNKKGSIQAEKPGDVEISLFFYRNGEPIGMSGASDFVTFLRTWEVQENIGSSCIEARFVMEDSAGLIAALSGSEIVKLNIKTHVIDRVYFFRLYGIEARSKTNQGTDMYILNATSDEFIKNEVTNLFGHSNTIFDKQTEASQIVKKVLGPKILKSDKKVFAEETLNNHSFISPNWRPFDLIYWISQRTIRKAQKGGTLQNGFAFFENALGYHFKSIDKMIEDINEQKKEATKFNDTTGSAVELYTYEYVPKNTGDGSDDQYKIESVQFPDEKNFLMGLRHGAWAGYSIGFDPATLANSKIGGSEQLQVDSYKYSIQEMWRYMSHLKSDRCVCPVDLMDENVQGIINYPRRVRYTALPNQIFDPKNQDNPQKNYEQLVELQAYQWIRLEAIKTIKLRVRIPGNLDLYAGSGINIILPTNDGKTELDRKYSGRYLIAGLQHQSVATTMFTELYLMKDTIYPEVGLIKNVDD